MINELKQGIAKELKTLWPTTKVYFSPNVQNAVVPCFYIFNIQAPRTRGVSNRNYYDLQFDIIYCLEEHTNNLDDTLSGIADTLDNIDTIDYLVKENNAYVSKGKINIIDAVREIDDNELHYKVSMRVDYIKNNGVGVITNTNINVGGL